MTNIQPTLRDSHGRIVPEKDWVSRFGNASEHAHIWQVAPGKYYFTDFPTDHDRKSGVLNVDAPSYIIASTDPKVAGFAVEPDLRAIAEAERIVREEAARARKSSIMRRAVLVGSAR